jgi:hypothetical protein
MLIGHQAVLLHLASLQVIYPAEGLQYPSWLDYLVIGAFYSVAVFFEESSGDLRAIFSKQSKRNLAEVLLIHLLFLALLFVSIWEAPQMAGYLPAWMVKVRDMGDTYSSIAELLLALGAMILAVCERAWFSARRAG